MPYYKGGLKNVAKTQGKANIYGALQGISEGLFGGIRQARQDRDLGHLGSQIGLDPRASRALGAQAMAGMIQDRYRTDQILGRQRAAADYDAQLKRQIQQESDTAELAHQKNVGIARRMAIGEDVLPRMSSDQLGLLEGATLRDMTASAKEVAEPVDPTVGWGTFSPQGQDLLQGLGYDEGSFGRVPPDESSRLYRSVIDRQLDDMPSAGGGEAAEEAQRAEKERQLLGQTRHKGFPPHLQEIFSPEEAAAMEGQTYRAFLNENAGGEDVHTPWGHLTPAVQEWMKEQGVDETRYEGFGFADQNYYVETARERVHADPEDPEDPEAPDYDQLFMRELSLLKETRQALASNQPVQFMGKVFNPGNPGEVRRLQELADRLEKQIFGVLGLMSNKAGLHGPQYIPRGAAGQGGGITAEDIQAVMEGLK